MTHERNRNYKPIQLLKEIQANQKSAYETEETEEEL